MKRLAAALVLLLVPLAPRAEFFSGNDLLERLVGDAAARRMGVGYVAGVFDAGFGTAHCPPPNATLGQVVDMVRASVEALPAERHRPADLFVTLTLKQAWPCPERRGPPGRGV